MQDTVFLSPTLVTPDPVTPIDITPATFALPTLTIDYELPLPQQLYGGKVSIKKPEDLDRIPNLRAMNMELPLLIFAIDLQTNIKNRYAIYFNDLESRLSAEVAQLAGQQTTVGHTQAQKQLSALRQLITQKRAALLDATAKAKLFPLQDPVNDSAKSRNALAFSRRLQKALSSRQKPSTAYTLFSNAVIAGHERQLLTQSLSQLEKRAIALSADIAAKAEAKRIADEKANAARIKAEQTKAETARIKAEQAQTETLRKANTYHVSGELAATGAAFITAAGSVASSSVDFSLRAAIGSAIGALAGFTSAVASGFLVGVSALLYAPRLGNGELPQRYALSTPLSDLAPTLDRELKAGTTATSVSLPYRISSQAGVDGQSEVFVVKTDGKVVPSQVRVIAATYNQQQKVYSATTADVPPRTLTWTPAVSPGNTSTTLPAEQTEAPIYPGATLASVEVRIDSFPGLPDASFDDYVIVFPADSGLPPIYTMFRDRREDPGVGSGHGPEVDEGWSAGAAVGAGAPIPRQIADYLKGQSFTSWRAYRETLWKAVGNDDSLSKQFSTTNIARMKDGLAPYAPSKEYAGARWVYELHHSLPISQGGEVYNAENIRVTTPRLHVEIHKRNEK